MGKSINFTAVIVSYTNFKLDKPNLIQNNFT